MKYNVRKLRDRITIERPEYSQDSTTGDLTPTWETVQKVWASIDYFKATEVMAAQAQQSKVFARITMKFRSDVTPNMRINSDNGIFTIEGIMPDNDSGREFMTLLCAKGVKDE